MPGKREMIENFPYKVGDTIKVDVPEEIGREIKDFTILKIYFDYVLLSDGIINVCWDIGTVYYMKKGDVLIGTWT